ncbi:response regulator [Methanococcoides sp. SA1]|nr:response regulator [Methanococcoides sp. SA1]
MTEFKKLEILIAEDDDGHAELITMGLQDSGVCNKITRFSDGKEAWEFLKNCGEGSDRSYLLLLDINMPNMDGVEVLSRMKQSNCLKKIPVIMLTTTDDPREVERCYELGCSVYITKPVDFTDFSEKLRRLGLFVQIVSV